MLRPSVTRPIIAASFALLALSMICVKWNKVRAAGRNTYISIVQRRIQSWNFIYYFLIFFGKYGRLEFLYFPVLCNSDSKRMCLTAILWSKIF